MPVRRMTSASSADSCCCSQPLSVDEICSGFASSRS
jgi:hypothetical protein